MKNPVVIYPVQADFTVAFIWPGKDMAFDFVDERVSFRLYALFCRWMQRDKLGHGCGALN
jgi:hypothetical protein